MDTQREPNLEEWISRELKHSLVRREYESLRTRLATVKRERDGLGKILADTEPNARKLSQVVLELAELTTAIKEAAALCYDIQRSPKGSVGTMNNVYVCQLDRKRVDKIATTLASAIER